MSAVPFLPVTALHLAGCSHDGEQPAPLLPWTEGRTERLRELHALEWKPRRIATEMGTTRNAVIGKLYRLGLCGPASVKRAKPKPARPVRNGQAVMASIMAKAQREAEKKVQASSQEGK